MSSDESKFEVGVATVINELSSTTADRSIDSPKFVELKNISRRFILRSTICFNKINSLSHILNYSTPRRNPLYCEYAYMVNAGLADSQSKANVMLADFRLMLPSSGQVRLRIGMF
jgi:hypothetical protein